MCAPRQMVWASLPWLQLMSMYCVSYCFHNTELYISGMSSYPPISADSPEVSLHQQYEHSAMDKGITIKIDCVAHGNPSPQVCDTFAELEKEKGYIFRSIIEVLTFATDPDHYNLQSSVKKV